MNAESARATFAHLVALMARLRGPGGCPWDREQTHETLRPYVLEEAYEVVDAIERADPARLQDELGDLLLQVIFHAQMASEAGRFTIDDVVAGLADKLVRRHPHVFGEAAADDAAQVLARWEAVKQEEQAAAGGRPASALAGVPGGLPALMWAQKIQERAMAAGFRWPHVAAALDKVAEELAEVRAAATENPADRTRLAEETGDLLFTVVNVAIFADVDAETVLRGACRRVMERFQQLEAQAAAEGRALSERSLDELLAMWRRAR
ncbi:MAG: nucleoside triphosphate pyrophosphohydrolase [Armatimonadetes bacterium]|nr:nucleoside triphosphate pyrophosphohydrolase [Armatimonadota bacterium]